MLNVRTCICRLAPIIRVLHTRRTPFFPVACHKHIRHKCGIWEDSRVEFENGDTSRTNEQIFGRQWNDLGLSYPLDFWADRPKHSLHIQVKITITAHA